MYQFHITKKNGLQWIRVIFTFMQLTLPPLFAMEVISVLLLRVTGNAADDFKPVNGATMVAWAGEVATAAEESVEEAIITSFSLFYYLFLYCFGHLYIVRPAWGIKPLDQRVRDSCLMITSLPATGLRKGVDTLIDTDHYDKATWQKISLSYLFLEGNEWMCMVTSVHLSRFSWLLPFGRKEMRRMTYI